MCVNNSKDVFLKKKSQCLLTNLVKIVTESKCIEDPGEKQDMNKIPYCDVIDRPWSQGRKVVKNHRTR
jgi:hypothetical protein